MDEGTEWQWRFGGFESTQEGRPVQVWFDSLPEEVKDEIRDLLTYLEKMTDRLWRKPEFDGLKGAGGISELRPRAISIERNGKIETETYRIYGVFGPSYKRTYTFLHGTRKGVKNDRHGKRVARDRLQQLEKGTATVHEFEL
jgi:hypothetical protein